MTTGIIKLFACGVVGAILCLGAELAAAKGGGGWHGGGRSGGAHIGGARMGGARIGNFSGRMGGLRTANFSGMRMNGLRAGKFSGARMNGLRAANLNGKWTSRNRFASINGTRHNALNSAHTLGGRAAWNKWGNHQWTAWNGRRGRWGGWFGPVFWPFFYGDLFAFVLWPYGFYDPFWAYGDIFVWDAILWPGPYYASGPAYYDVYGDNGYGRSARASVARNSAREITGSIPDSKDLAQTCAGLAPGVTDLPMDRIEKTISLTDEQLKALDTLKAATSNASDLLKSSCSNEVSLTPLGRLEAVQKRLDGMIQALGIVRTPLDNFYNSLNEEQRQRFAALGPPHPSTRAGRRGSASGDNLEQLCSRQTEGFTQLPVQRIEQTVKPTQPQQDAFDKLKTASIAAANQLQSSCPAETPQTPMDRFDAVGRRLDAMAAAIKIVQPALTIFYLSLTDEQKARFNLLAPSKTTMYREG